MKSAFRLDYTPKAIFLAQRMHFCTGQNVAKISKFIRYTLHSLTTMTDP